MTTPPETLAQRDARLAAELTALLRPSTPVRARSVRRWRQRGAPVAAGAEALARWCFAHSCGPWAGGRCDVGSGWDPAADTATASPPAPALEPDVAALVELGYRVVEQESAAAADAWARARCETLALIVEECEAGADPADLREALRQRGASVPAAAVEPVASAPAVQDLAPATSPPIAPAEPPAAPAPAPRSPSRVHPALRRASPTAAAPAPAAPMPEPEPQRFGAEWMRTPSPAVLARHRARRLEARRTGNPWRLIR